jgi:hypothetical protein
VVDRSNNTDLSVEPNMSAAQISVRSQLLTNVEFADKPWFYQTMTREQAEQARLRVGSTGSNSRAKPALIVSESEPLSITMGGNAMRSSDI